MSLTAEQRRALYEGLIDAYTIPQLRIMLSLRLNDSPVSAAQCASATRDDSVAADSGPLDETGPGVPSARRWPQSRVGRRFRADLGNCIPPSAPTASAAPRSWEDAARCHSRGRQETARSEAERRD